MRDCISRFVASSITAARRGFLVSHIFCSVYLATGPRPRELARKERRGEKSTMNAAGRGAAPVALRAPSAAPLPVPPPARQRRSF